MSRDADETAIRDLVQGRAGAVRRGDVEAVMSVLAPGVTSFDVVTPLRVTGAEDVRDRLEAWLAGYEGPVDYEIRELTVTAGADVAFCHGLVRVSGTLTDGAAVDMWVRDTLGLRRIDGRWMIVHEHMSSPFDPATGEAALDIAP